MPQFDTADECMTLRTNYWFKVPNHDPKLFSKRGNKECRVKTEE